MKMIKQCLFALGLCLFGGWSVKAKAQIEDKPQRGYWSVQIGTATGVNYEYIVGQRCSVRGAAGLALATNYRSYYGGFIPYASLEPRFYFGKDGVYGGGFLSLGVDALWTSMRLLVDRSRFDPNHLYTFSLVPGGGYIMPIGEQWAMRYFAGLDLRWHAVRKDGSTEFIREESSLPITFGVGVELRL